MEETLRKEIDWDRRFTKRCLSMPAQRKSLMKIKTLTVRIDTDFFPEILQI